MLGYGVTMYTNIFISKNFRLNKMFTVQVQDWFSIRAKLPELQTLHYNA